MATASVRKQGKGKQTANGTGKARTARAVPEERLDMTPTGEAIAKAIAGAAAPPLVLERDGCTVILSIGASLAVTEPNGGGCGASATLVSFSDTEARVDFGNGPVAVPFEALGVYPGLPGDPCTRVAGVAAPSATKAGKPKVRRILIDRGDVRLDIAVGAEIIAEDQPGSFQGATLVAASEGGLVVDFGGHPARRVVGFNAVGIDIDSESTALPKVRFITDDLPSAEALGLPNEGRRHVLITEGDCMRAAVAAGSFVYVLFESGIMCERDVLEVTELGVTVADEFEKGHVFRSWAKVYLGVSEDAEVRAAGHDD